MSYDPATEMTRADVVGLIAAWLERESWQPRDFEAEAEAILQRVARESGTTGLTSAHKPPNTS